MTFSISAAAFYTVLPVNAGIIIRRPNHCNTPFVWAMEAFLKKQNKSQAFSSCGSSTSKQERENSICYWSCMMEMPDDKHQLADRYGGSAARSTRPSWQTPTRATGKYTQDNNLHIPLSSFIATYSTSAFLPSLPVCHHIPPSPPCVLSWQRLGRLIIMPACL